MAVGLAAQSRQTRVAQRIDSRGVQEVVTQIGGVGIGVQQERKAQVFPLLENR
jgi:hypothetical protein